MRELISVPTGREEYAPMTSLVQSLALAACGQNRAVFRSAGKSRFAPCRQGLAVASSVPVAGR